MTTFLKSIQSPRWQPVAFLPLVFVAAIVSSSYLIPQANVAGLLSILALGILALFMRPLWLLFWCAMFCVLFATSLLSDPEFMARPDAYIKVAVRLLTLLAGGAVAMFASHQRQKVAGSHDTLVEFVLQLPLPIVVSAWNGVVLFCNQKASDLLQRDQDDIVGTPFFSHLAAPTRDQGFQDYFDLLDSGSGKKQAFQLCLREQPDRTVAAQMNVLEIGGNRLAVTILHEDVAVKA